MIIDGKGHLLGRLASVIAKEILNGQDVVCYTHSFNQYHPFLFRLSSDARASTSPDPCSETS